MTASNRKSKHFLGFDPQNIPADLGAGLTMAMVAIPDSIASAILAGVNPIYAFNAMMVGLPVGSLFTSSEYLNLALTGAMMLALAGVMSGVSGAAIVPTLVTVTVLVGVFQLLFGLLKLGKLTQFISNSVMTGFFTGIAAIVVLSQLGGLTGYVSQVDGGYVVKAVDLFLHPAEVLQTWPSLALGLFTFALIIILEKTKLRNFALIIALLVASAVVPLLGADVHLVRDSFEIKGAVPLPALSDLLAGVTLIPKLLLPALAIALIGLIQGAGISQSIPNPDGDYPDVSGDFVGQGVANVASGLFRGLPVGGSLAGTAVNVTSGARSRWANVFGGLIIIPLVLLLGDFVGLIAEPAIAALLIAAGLQTVNRERISDVWHVGVGPRLIMLFTLVATLALPVQWAVFLGVTLSFLVYVIGSAGDIQVKEVVRRPDGLFEEQDAPEKLRSNAVTVLHVWGNLFFSGAYALQDRLPDDDGVQRPVVILRLRGRESIGSTFLKILERYAGELRQQGGKLMLSGVSEGVLKQLEKTGSFEAIPREDIFLATDVLGESTVRAIDAAQTWLAQDDGSHSKPNA
jgi:SulP family sulfate permease